MEATTRGVSRNGGGGGAAAAERGRNPSRRVDDRGESTPRERGNKLFVAGDYAGAIAEYTSGLDATSGGGGGEDGRTRRRSQSSSSSSTSTSTSSSSSPSSFASERAILFSNRAACHLHLGAKAAAAADCRASIGIDACNCKVWARLAQSLPVDDIDAALAICNAIALNGGGWEQSEILYSSIRTHHQAWMPEYPECIVLVSSASELLGAFSAAAKCRQSDVEGSEFSTVLVLRPGTYTTRMLLLADGIRFPFFSSSSSSSSSKTCIALIGLGTVELASLIGHAISMDGEKFSMLIANLDLTGNGCAAAVCAASDARLRLINCRIHDYPEVGILVAGGHVELSHCSFCRTDKQAIEVREGGTLLADSISVVDCKQGITAYGGARRVVVKQSRIEGSRLENVMAVGTYENVPTALQAETFGGSRNEASAAAVLWGRQSRVELEMTLSECIIARSGQFGLSADLGAEVILSKCRFEHCDMPAVFVKGATNVCIHACQFIYGGGKSKQKWGGYRLSQAAIHVAINYGGIVDVVDNAFAGPAQLAVFEEAKHDSTWMGSRVMIKHMGFWSRPANVKNNRQFTLAEADSLPPVSLLAGQRQGNDGDRTRQDPGQHVEGGGVGTPRMRTLPPDMSAHRRLYHTLQRAQWDPLSNTYYAIGNSFGYDVAGGCSSVAVGSSMATMGGKDDGDGVLRILFAACGDIRNLLATARSVTGRRTHYVLNDGNLSMLARDVVLVHMAVELDATPDVILAVWANHALTESQGASLAQSLSMLALKPWPTWLSAAFSLDPDAPADARAETSLRAIFRSWADCKTSMAELRAHRDAFLQGVLDYAIELSVTATGGRFQQVVSSYLRTGTIECRRSSSGNSKSSRRSSSDKSASSEPLTRANVTFLLAPVLEYTVYFSSSIFRAVPLDSKCSTAFEGLMMWITPRVTSLASSLRSGTAALRLVPGDILDLMTSPPAAAAAEEEESNSSTRAHPPPRHHPDMYDFIDCSNVADYVSVPALLQAAAPVLAHTPSSRLRFESRLSYAAQAGRGPNADPDPIKFLESQLDGLSLATYEALLGFRLIGVDRTVKGKEQAAAAVRFEIAPAATAGACVVAQHLPRERVCGISGLYLLLELLAACKASMPSPTSLVHLLATAFADNDAEPMVKALFRCDPEGQAPLFKWELLLHAKIQAALARSNSPSPSPSASPSTIITNLGLLLATYDASPGFALLPYRDDPILLAFSLQPLSSGLVAKQSVRQLMGSFEWLDDIARVRFLVTSSVFKQCESWYVTLCVVSRGLRVGLVAVGVSEKLSSLETVPAPVGEIRPWRRASYRQEPEEPTSGVGTGRVRPGEHVSPYLTMDMVDMLFSVNDRAKEWHGTVHSFPECLVVDVIAPEALPAQEDAKMSVLVKDKCFSVSVFSTKEGAGRRGEGRGEQNRGGGGGGVRGRGRGRRHRGSTSSSESSHEKFRLELPCDVPKDNEACDIKISRKLGAISARIWKVHEAQ